MADFVLVPGAWHGGRWYQPVVDALEQAGHRAHAVSPAPLPFFDERARRHSLATLVQAVRRTGAWKQIPVNVFVAALDTPGGQQAPASMAKVHNDVDWRYEEWHTSHNVLRDGPTAVLDLLLRSTSK